MALKIKKNQELKINLFFKENNYFEYEMMFFVIYFKIMKVHY